MGVDSASRWIVLKFGGTSVSTLPNWTNIATVAQRRLAEGANVLIVHSAVSGITDRLEKLLAAAQVGEHEAALAAIEGRHLQLCEELGVSRTVLYRCQCRRYLGSPSSSVSRCAAQRTPTVRSMSPRSLDGHVMATWMRY